MFKTRKTRIEESGSESENEESQSEESEDEEEKNKIIENIKKNMRKDCISYLTTDNRKNPLDKKLAKLIVSACDIYLYEQAEEMYKDCKNAQKYDAEYDLGDGNNYELDWYREFLEDFQKVFAYEDE